MPLTVDPAPADDLIPDPDPSSDGPDPGPTVTYERLAVQSPVTELQQLDNPSGEHVSRVSARELRLLSGILRVWYMLAVTGRVVPDS